MTRSVPVLGCTCESVRDLGCSERAWVVLFRVVSMVWCAAIALDMPRDALEREATLEHEFVMGAPVDTMSC